MNKAEMPRRRVPGHDAATPADCYATMDNSASCRPNAGKSQARRGVDGWTAASLDAASRMGQRGRGSVAIWSVSPQAQQQQEQDRSQGIPLASHQVARVTEATSGVVRVHHGRFRINNGSLHQ